MTATTAWLGLGLLALAGVLLLAGLAIYWRKRDVSLLGPLFAHEAVLLVRSRAHILLRIGYPTVLLILLGFVFLLQTNHLGIPLWDRLTEPVVPVTMMANFSLGFFVLFAFIQFLFLCTLTVRVSAAAVAEDRDRRRLDFLLATPLENHEIVLGKLAARLATCFLLALAAVPVIGLLPLFGGVEPLLVAGVILFTLITMIWLAVLSVACSIYASNTDQAIGSVIVFVILYHIISGLPYAIAIAWSVPPGPLLDALSLLNSGNVVAAVAEVIREVDSGGDLNTVLPVTLLRYAVFYALVILVSGRIAIVRLRSAGREANEKRPDPTTLSPEDLKKVFLVDRPPVSDEPILWKSIYIEDDMQPRHGQRVIRIGTPMEKSRERVLTRCLFVGSMFLPLVVVGIVVWLDHGNWCEIANMLFRGIGTLLGCFAWMRMGGQAICTMAGEREQRTLYDLMLTSLERREILKQKWRGAMRLGFYPMLWVAGYGVVTMLCGGLHVLGLPLFLAVWLVYAVFLVNLALWFSTISPTKRVATRRMILTLGGVVFGAMFLLSPPGDVRVVAGCVASVIAPLVLGGSGLSSEQIGETLAIPYQGLFSVGVALGVLCQGILAGYLWHATVKRFERENAETVLSHRL